MKIGRMIGFVVIIDHRNSITTFDEFKVRRELVRRCSGSELKRNERINNTRKNDGLIVTIDHFEMMNNEPRHLYTNKIL